jgi:hypothetical protein
MSALSTDVARTPSQQRMFRGLVETRCLTMRASTHVVAAYDKTNLADKRTAERWNCNRGRWPRDMVGRVLNICGSIRGFDKMGERLVGLRRMALQPRRTDCGPRTGRRSEGGLVGELPEGGNRVKCPKCGHNFKAVNQTKGGKARWRGMTKSQRKQAASAAAKARWSKSTNEKLCHAAESERGAQKGQSK